MWSAGGIAYLYNGESDAYEAVSNGTGSLTDHVGFKIKKNKGS